MTVFVARWRSCPSSRRSRRFGGPYAVFFVAALCFATFPSSAEAQNTTPGIVLDVGDSMTVREPVQTTYRIKLATKPTGNVNVWVGSNSDGSGKSRYVAFGVNFTFTPTNWSEWVTMSLGTGHDSDGDNHTVKLHHVVRPTYLSPPTKPPLYTPIPPPPEYKGVKKTLTISELDDDRVVVLSSPKVTVPEGGTKTYTAKLKVEPYNQVTVTVARKSGDSNLSVNPTSLTFTPTTWNTAQTLTLSAAEDSDNAHGSAVFTHTTSANYEGIPTELTAVENDNDVGLNLPSGVSVPEGGTKSYEVTLNSQPTANVTVSVARKSTGIQDQDLSVQSGALLTFTTQNWSTPQTVTLAADEEGSRSGGRSSDPYDGEDGSAVFTHTVSGGNYDNVGVAELTATEADNDRKLLISSDTFYQVNEGSTATYKVQLKSQPTADVTVKVALKSGDPHLSVSRGASLTFTTNNWSTDKTVTLAAAEDADYANGSAVFTHTVSGGNWNVVQEATFTERDNDTLKKKPVLPSPVYVPEEGTLAVPMILGTQPQSSVTVTVAKTINFNPSGCLVFPSPGDTDLTASPSTFTFTSTNWFTPQIVTLSAADDSDNTDNCDAFKFTASGDNNKYSGAQTLEAYESDNDVTGRALTLSATNVSVPEDGEKTYTVKLASAPAADVTVTVARKSGSDQDTDLTVDTDSNTEGNQDTLTFTDQNWNTAQTVTLFAADDSDDVNGTAVITHIPAGPWRSAAVELTATEADNDYIPPAPPPPSLVLSPTNVTVPESGTATYTVTLGTLPTADVTVTVASDDTGAVTVAPGTLTFTPSNYSSAQTVTVTGVIDADDEDERVALSHEAQGGGYSASATVTVLVNDRTPLTFGDQTIPDQTYVHRTAIGALTLPAAMENKGSVHYVLSPALPAGLTFDPGTRVLAGTPTEVQAATPYTYTATDVDGVTATVTFTLTVTADVEPAFDDDPLVIGPLISDQTYVHRMAITAWTLPAATGGNGDLTYALSPALPAGLTFDPGTRVLAGTPTETQAATSYTYTATDVDGDVVTVTFTLTVTADVEPTFEDDPLVTGPLIPDQAYVHRTAITAWTLPAATGGNPPLTYTLAASEFAIAETRSPAPAGSGAPAAQPAGLTFTPATQPLTGTPSVLESETAEAYTEPADASATLPAGLTFDPETRVLTGTPTETQEAIRYIYTATDVDGDPAMVTFTILVEADVEPAFDVQAIDAQAIADQTYLQQKAIRALTLPAATGGNGALTYAITPALPAGLTFDPGTRVLAGTPTEPQAATRYTYTATDGDGDPATVPFTITVHAAAEKALLKTGLAAQGRALLSGVTGVIGERFRSPGAASWAGAAAACTGAPPTPADARGGASAPPDPAGSVPQAEDCATGLLTTVAQAVLGVSGIGGGATGTNSLNLTDADDTRPRGPRMINGGTQPAWNWESLVWGRSFALPLKKPGSPGNAWTLWGAGDIQGFQGNPEQGRYDGQIRSLYLGVDAQWHEHWLAGAAVAQSWGETDYAAVAGGSDGQLETSLTSIYPYVRGSLGRGTGSVGAWGVWPGRSRTLQVGPGRGGRE